jgi:hypothetical protein
VHCRGIFLVLAVLCLLPACERDDRTPADAVEAEPAEAASVAGFRFVDVAAEAGLDRVVLAGRPGKDHLLDSAGTGAAWLDFDRDGWIDAYIVNGWKLDGESIVERGRNALYRNRGDGTFEDVTDRAGVTGEGHWGSGVAVADYDGDGWPDLLVTNFGPNLLYRNRGDGTFENVAAAMGIEAPGWNTGAAFLDADGDGDLDLYVATYIDQSIDDVLAAQRTLDWKGLEKVALGPFGLPGAVDVFFVNEGGRYREATREAGLVDLGEGFGFAVRAADLDHDGDVDIYVANDSDPNYFYRNEGDGTFREVGLWSGTALDGNGAAQAGMGVAVGDADNDGFLDIVVTNFSEDFSTMYRGDGGGFFDDVSSATGVGESTYASLSWGTTLADLDNDGDQDLVIANGHIYPQVDTHPEFELTYAQRNQLLENDGTGQFRDVTDRAGPGFAQLRSSRGLAAGDYDNDGDLDLLVTHLDEPPSLLRNDSGGGAWLAVALEAPPGDGTVIGAEVRLRIGDRTLIRDRASGGSFLSVHDPRLHFGLGQATRIDALVVRWPDGNRTELRDLGVDQLITVRK